MGQVFIGVDPGSSGGMALIRGSDIVITVPMPATERDIWDWFRSCCGDKEYAFAYIELVHAMPGNGVSGMFKFGKSYGGLRMALIAAGVPFEEVTPQRWQKGLHIPPCKKEESKTDFKNRLKAKAQSIYPKQKIIHATADALLLATYCQRMRQQQTEGK